MMKYVYGRKKWLAAGIAALLISGAGAVPDVLAAPVYTSGITTKAKKDKATFGSAYKVENGVNKYNLEDGSKISIHGTYYAEGITPGKGPLILPAVTREIRRGRGFSHLTGAG